MLKKIWRVSVSVFAILGFGYTALKLVSLALALPGSTQLHQLGQKVSPDGNYRFIIEQQEGGDSISPFCRSYVLVVPVQLDLVNINKRRFEVFGSDECDSFLDHSSSPKVSWLDNTHIKIDFSINHSAASLQTVHIRKIDSSGKISLIYAIGE